MLDAGPAREYDRHVYNSQFESITIRKLLSSPDYLGRSYLTKCRNTEKYIKNKEICDLIDKLRYKPESRKLPFIQQDYANLHYKGYNENTVDGGFANTTYRFIDKLDLGNAYPPQKTKYQIPRQIDLGNACSQPDGCCDLGDAYPPRKATIDLGNERNTLDLGDAYRPQQGNYNLGNAYPPQQGNCNFPGNLDLGNASLSHEIDYSPCR
jgi:hypothetical protein